VSRLPRSADGSGSALDRLLRVVVSLLATRLLPGRSRAGGLSLLLRRAAPVGGAELDRLPTSVRGAVRALGSTGAGRLPLRRQAAAARAAVTRHVRGARASARRPARAGAGRRREPSGRRAPCPAARLDGPPARTRPARSELGRGRRRPRRPRERLAGRGAVPLPPLSRAAVRRLGAPGTHRPDPTATRRGRRGVRVLPPSGRAGRSGVCAAAASARSRVIAATLLAVQFLERVRRCHAPLLPFVIIR